MSVWPFMAANINAVSPHRSTASTLALCVPARAFTVAVRPFSAARINAVSPSIALHDFLKKASSEQLLEQLASREAFGRAAEVWEVANVMMFLASDYASYMVGEVLSVSSQHA